MRSNVRSYANRPTFILCFSFRSQVLTVWDRHTKPENGLVGDSVGESWTPCFFPDPTTPQTEKDTKMDVTIQGYDETEHVIEVGEDDTTEALRRKVATATGLAEDSFHMGFGGKEEGEDITELSAGDKVVLTKTTKYEAIAALRVLGETDITDERLKKVTDPKVASLLLQAEVVTAIPDSFFKGSAVTCIGSSCVSIVDDIRDTSLPHCDTILDLPKLPFVTAIGRRFLSDCTMLSTVDLTDMQAVTSIGDYFLCDCTTLSTVDLTGMQAVTSIGNNFLRNCTTLSTVDLTGMQAVTSIGDNFLAGCTKLSSVDFTGMQAVTSIGNYFLVGCTKLSTVDLTGMQAVTSIGNNFLRNCTKLSTVDLTGMQAVTSIGEDFLRNCTTLSTVDLTGMQAVSSIGEDFLCNCKTLSTVHLTGVQADTWTGRLPRNVQRVVAVST